MRKLRKLVLTTAALAALAVGGAAFAQAQSAGPAAQMTVQQPKGETSTPGDSDGVQGGDQGSQAGAQESGEESQTETPDSASESDGPDGHHDESGSAGAVHESEGD